MVPSTNCLILGSKIGRVHEGHSRSSTMKLDALKGFMEKKLNDCSIDSSTFKLKYLKIVVTEVMKKNADQDGLDSESVKYGITDRIAKTMIIAAAMEESGPSLTNRKLLAKTEKQFQSENSIMGVYAYTLTSLSTHFISGHCPPNNPVPP